MRLLNTIQRSLSNMLVRAVVQHRDGSRKNQVLQISMVAGELKSNIEHLEPYGFTSAPHLGAEAFAAYPDGDRSHGVVLVVADRRYRLTGLDSGEVAIYSDEGDSIILKRGNQIEVKTQTLTINAATQVQINSPLVAMSGRLTVAGNIEGAAQVQDQASTMSAIRTTYNGHTHPHGEPTTGTPNNPMR
ncbi:phage baseplate assembly protein V [Serratia microhaemolytica]|uniref:phage baseplate assembly protein V n=1 Tax=Serratia microhaemolytica TaxID=2675110 RepID=UPI000FDEB11C|nr:phage baseplate assembly protein V [Serratia microhaemolytica]